MTKEVEELFGFFNKDQKDQKEEKEQKKEKEVNIYEEMLKHFNFKKK